MVKKTMSGSLLQDQFAIVHRNAVGSPVRAFPQDFGNAAHKPTSPQAHKPTSTSEGNMTACMWNVALDHLSARRMDAGITDCNTRFVFSSV